MTENEIQYIIDSVSEACAFLENNSIYHGDIRPLNILLTPEGLVKIADHALINQDLNAYIKVVAKNETECLLSPALLLAASINEMKPRHDPFKSDVFSLGMTILEISTLQKVRNCYDYYSFKIKYDFVQNLIAQVRSKYSNFLANLIEEMLSLDETSRPSFYQIHSMIQEGNVNKKSQIIINNETSSYQKMPNFNQQFYHQPQTYNSIIQPKLKDSGKMTNYSAKVPIEITNSPIGLYHDKIPNLNQSKVITQPNLMNSNAININNSVYANQHPLQQSDYNRIPNFNNNSKFMQNSGFQNQMFIKNSGVNNYALNNNTLSYSLQQNSNIKNHSAEGSDKLSELDRKINNALATTQQTIRQHG